MREIVKDKPEFKLLAKEREAFEQAFECVTYVDRKSVKRAIRNLYKRMDKDQERINHLLISLNRDYISRDYKKEPNKREKISSKSRSGKQKSKPVKAADERS
jgi:hypothetical protein